MKYFILVLTLLWSNHSIAQFVADFENFDLALDEYDNDGQSDGGYESGSIFFPNVYDAGFDTWTDWAISTLRDTITEGFLNPLSSYAGGGRSSQAYAVASAYEPVLFKMQEPSQGKTINGLYLSNNTYAALSMKNGDSFAKKFGGETGADPDFFKVTIRKWLNGERSLDSVDFYLADYRFEDNSEDYIIKNWAYVDLQSLGAVDSVEFTLSSSDIGAFGMNTPAFFCIDNVLVDIQSSTFEPDEALDISVHPNPTSDFLMIKGIEMDGQLVDIYNFSGQRVLSNISANQMIDVKNLHPGNYFLVLNINGKSKSLPFMKME